MIIFFNGNCLQDLYNLFILSCSMREYQDGPIPNEKRSCTDSCCLFIFFLLTVAIFGVAIYSWNYGNFKKLTNAYDPDGKGCGVDYPSFPYIYFVSPHADSLWVTVCVSACPVDGDTVLKCQPNSVVTSCDAVNNSDNTKTVQIYDTTLTANTACLPTSKTLSNAISQALGSETKQITTLMDNYVLILISFPIAIILALVIMIIIRFLASCFIYILIFVAIAALVGIGAYILTQSPTGASPGTVSLTEDKTFRVVVAVLCFLLAAVICVVMCCFKKRLELASRIVQVAAVFVAGNCGIVLVPFLMFLITIVFLAIWIIQALGFYSLGTPKHTQHQYPYQHFQVSNQIMILGGVHVFYLFWGVFYLIETSSFLVIGTAASWYYKTDSPYSETSSRYFWKHMGSVIFGAFFKALIGFIKFMYELLTPEKQDDPTGWKAKFQKCCDCICCLCMKLFDWLNSGAYAVVNITGDSYCDSALKAASLRLNNLAATSILAVLSTVFTVIVRLGITALTVLAVYLIATKVETFRVKLDDPTLILVIVGLSAFAISCFFIAVYSDAMESIYTTYLIDSEAGGKPGNNCPKELQEFLDDAAKEQHIVQN